MLGKLLNMSMGLYTIFLETRLLLFFFSFSVLISAMAL